MISVWQPRVHGQQKIHMVHLTIVLLLRKMVIPSIIVGPKTTRMVGGIGNRAHPHQRVGCIGKKSRIMALKRQPVAYTTHPAKIFQVICLPKRTRDYSTKNFVYGLSIFIIYRAHIITNNAYYSIILIALLVATIILISRNIPFIGI